MKILFLDCDGVLNRCGKSNQGLETDKLELLAQIVRCTGCRIVVSSTWRKSETWMARLLEALRSHGIGAETVIGLTPVLESRKHGSPLYIAVERRFEILRWLEDHILAPRMAILDDDTDADTGTGDFFPTDSFTGLTPAIANRVIAHLNQPVPLTALGKEVEG